MHNVEHYPINNYHHSSSYSTTSKIIQNCEQFNLTSQIFGLSSSPESFYNNEEDTNIFVSPSAQPYDVAVTTAANEKQTILACENDETTFADLDNEFMANKRVGAVATSVVTGVLNLPIINNELVPIHGANTKILQNTQQQASTIGASNYICGSSSYNNLRAYSISSSPMLTIETAGVKQLQQIINHQVDAQIPMSVPFSSDGDKTSSHQQSIIFQNAVNATSRYKTELCRPYEESGECKYGDKCQFAHGISEMRNMTRHHKYKTESCRTFHSIGFCPYGPRCHFIHNGEDLVYKMPQGLKSPGSSFYYNFNHTNPPTNQLNHTVRNSFQQARPSLPNFYDLTGRIHEPVTVQNCNLNLSVKRHFSLPINNNNINNIDTWNLPSQGDSSPPLPNHPTVDPSHDIIRSALLTVFKMRELEKKKASSNTVETPCMVGASQNLNNFTNNIPFARPNNGNCNYQFDSGMEDNNGNTATFYNTALMANKVLPRDVSLRMATATNHKLGAPSTLSLNLQEVNRRRNGLVNYQTVTNGTVYFNQHAYPYHHNPQQQHQLSPSTPDSNCSSNESKSSSDYSCYEGKTSDNAIKTDCSTPRLPIFKSFSSTGDCK